MGVILTGHSNAEIAGRRVAALTRVLALAEPALDADDYGGPPDVPVPREDGGHGKG